MDTDQVNQYFRSLIRIGHAEVDQDLDEADAALEDHGIMVDQGWGTAMVTDVTNRATSRARRGPDPTHRRGIWRDTGALMLRHIQGMLTSHRPCLLVGMVGMAITQEIHMRPTPMEVAEEAEVMGLNFQLMVSVSLH